VLTLMFMRKASRLQAGFTLTELMAVVIIVGVLAVTGVTYFRKHAFASKVTEAQAMVQSIRAAEERYRAENRQYLPTTSSSAWPTCQSKSGLYPHEPDGTSRPFFLPKDSTANDNARWWELKPTTSGYVQFGYAVLAGSPSPSTPVTLPPDIRNPPNFQPTDSWYAIEAIADNGNDNVCCIVAGTSMNGELYVQDEGE
jgi:prepilin-type N-terminal cleavage/methylation domain-containing protein